MNITKLQEKVKIQQQEEAQHKDNITNLRKEINEMKKRTTRTTATEKNITKEVLYLRLNDHHLSACFGTIMTQL